MKVIVRVKEGAQHTFRMKTNDTILCLKSKLAPVFQIPIELQRLVCHNQPLMNFRRLSSCPTDLSRPLFIFLTKLNDPNELTPGGADPKRLVNIVKEVCSLSKEDCVNVLGGFANANKYREVNKTIINRFQNAKRATVKQGLAPPPSESDKVAREVQLLAVQLNSGLAPGRKGTTKSELDNEVLIKALAKLKLPDLRAMGAFQVPLIVRADLLPAEGGNVFIAVKKLEMKKTWVTKGWKAPTMVAFNIAVVDEKGRLIFWAFIKREERFVQKFNAPTNEIDATKLRENGLDIEVVRPVLKKFFSGRCVVGHSLRDDLDSLSYQNEFEEERCFTTKDQFDLQDFYFYGHPQRMYYELKELVQHYFPGRNFQTDVHGAIEDARMILAVYLKMQIEKLRNPEVQAADLGIKKI